MSIPLMMLVQDAGAHRKGERSRTPSAPSSASGREAKLLDTKLRDDEQRDRFLGVWALNREMYERQPDFAETVRFMARGPGVPARTPAPEA